MYMLVKTLLDMIYFKTYEYKCNNYLWIRIILYCLELILILKNKRLNLSINMYNIVNLTNNPTKY